MTTFEMPGKISEILTRNSVWFGCISSNKILEKMIPKSKLNEPFQSFGIWYFLPIILINPTNHFQYILPLIGYQ
jgi:hypothetical protein